MFLAMFLEKESKAIQQHSLPSVTLAFWPFDFQNIYYALGAPNLERSGYFEIGG